MIKHQGCDNKLNVSEDISRSIENVFEITRKLEDTYSKISFCDVKKLRGDVDFFRDNLKKIKEKLSDKNFKIGVFGEFSCGKSTFINAFLEQRNLTEDVLEGTTCASTVICYAEKDNVIVHFNNGSQKRMIETGLKGAYEYGKDFFKIASDEISKEKSFKGICSGIFDRIKKPKEYDVVAFLNQFTATEEEGKQISEVIWETPIPILQEGFILIDTPGISSSNPRHTEVAHSAAAQCDILLVLSNISKPLSSDLIKAAKVISGEDGKKCIFIGTCLDRLAPKDQDRMRQFFAAKIKGSFAQARPYYFVAAYPALEDLKKEQSGEQGSFEYLLNFREFREELHRLLNSNRQLMQCVTASNFLSNFLKEMTNSLDEAQVDFKYKYHEFQNSFLEYENVSTNISYISDFKRRTIDIELSTRNEIHEVIKEIKYNIISKIRACEDDDELKFFLNEEMNGHIQTLNVELSKATESHVCESLEKAAETILKDLRASLQKKYSALKKIGGIQTNIKSTSHLLSISSQKSSLAKTDDLEALSSDFDFEDSVKIGGGLAAAAAISFMVPGVGWIAGGALTLLGGLFGAGFMTSLEDKKSQAIDKVEEFFLSILGDIDGQAVKITKELSISMERNLTQCVKEMDNRFKEAIDELNSDMAKRRSMLQVAITEVNTNKKELAILESELVNVTNAIAKHLKHSLEERYE